MVARYAQRHIPSGEHLYFAVAVAKIAALVLLGEDLCVHAGASNASGERGSNDLAPGAPAPDAGNRARNQPKRAHQVNGTVP
jgi:hypothetical protein